MSSNKCDINDVGQSPASLDPREAFEFLEGPNISIQVTKLSSKTQVLIGYKDYAAPAINVNADIPIAKVGVNFPLVNFNGNIVKGSEDIISRTMTPDKGLDLNAPLSWQESNVSSNVPGLFPQFSGNPLQIDVLDDTGNTVVKQVGVDFRHLTYMGFSANDVLTENQIKSLTTQDLLSTVLSKYASYTYNYTLQPEYLYWVFPADFTQFTYATEGILPVPLKMDLPNVEITDEGVTKSYRVIRTAVKSRFINSTIKLQ